MHITAVFPWWIRAHRCNILQGLQPLLCYLLHRAVVFGSGVAGLSAARVLSERFSQVRHLALHTKLLCMVRVVIDTAAGGDSRRVEDYQLRTMVLLTHSVNHLGRI